MSASRAHLALPIDLDYVPPACAEPRPLTELTVAAWDRWTGTPARALALSATVLGSLLVALGAIPTVYRGTDAKGGFLAHCGVGYYVFGHPNGAVQDGCRATFETHALVMGLGLALLLVGLAVGLVIARPAGSGVRRRFHAVGVVVTTTGSGATLALLSCVSVVVAAISLRTVVVSAVDAHGPFVARCGLSYYLGAAPNAVVKSVCVRGYRSHAELLLGTAVLLVVCVAVLFRQSLRVPPDDASGGDEAPRKRRASTRSVQAVLVLAVAGTLTTFGALQRADAAELVSFGWWTTANPGGQAGDVLGQAPVSPTAADVPSGGGLVQGAQGNTEAVAALSFAVPDDESPTAVQLAVAPQTGTLPGSALRACPLVSAAFTVAFGGPLADAPAADCAKPISGTLDAAGTTWSFPVAGLARDGELAIAVFPTGSLTRVVLAKPTDASLLFQTLPGADGSLPDAGFTPAPDTGTGVPPSLGLANPPVPPGPPPPTPQVAPSGTAGDTTPSAPTAAAFGITLVPSTSTPLPAGAAFGLFVVGVLAWFSWRRRPAVARSLPVSLTPTQEIPQ